MIRWSQRSCQHALLVLCCAGFWQPNAGVAAREGITTKLRFQGSLKTGARVNRSRIYWKEEEEALRLLEHFDSPPDEVAPKGNIPPELAFQQRYHPHTGVKWAEKQAMPLQRTWPKLPGDLLWRTTFSGCKEVKRPAWQRARKAADTCSIYILDASDVAEKVGVPRCDVQNFAIDPRKSMILPNPKRLGYPMPDKDSRIQASDAEEMYPWSTGPHYYAQSGGPYYFYRALLDSNLRSFDIETADAVFVYDYCYMIWGLAESHATKHWWLNSIVKYQPNPNVLSYMDRIYDEILGSPRFNKKFGKDYIFWLPHTAVFARPDIFGQELVDKFFQESGCNTARGSLFLAPTVYMRWRCTLYHPEKLLVVPQASMEVTSGDGSKRDIFINFKANCIQPDYYSVGKYLRSMLTQALVRTSQNASDLKVQCLNTIIGSPGYNEESHAQLIATLYRSVFCPVIPGDSQTSQHLTERYIAGCIPVFVGPPYHTMPFEKEVDYASSSVFLNVTDSAAWMRNDSMEWEFPMVPSGGWDHELVQLHALGKGAESPKWWFPWISTRYLINIPTLDDIIPALRAIPPQAIARLQRGVQRNRSKFIYAWGGYGEPGAIDIIVDNICHFVGKKCEPQVL